MTQTKHPFSVIELMVVIAIISLLASLLLPALNSAKEHAYDVNCKNNLKQIANGFHMYASDYNGWFPVSRVSSFYNKLTYFRGQYQHEWVRQTSSNNNTGDSHHRTAAMHLAPTYTSPDVFFDPKNPRTGDSTDTEYWENFAKYLDSGLTGSQFEAAGLGTNPGWPGNRSHAYHISTAYSHDGYSATSIPRFIGAKTLSGQPYLPIASDSYEDSQASGVWTEARHIDHNNVVSADGAVTHIRHLGRSTNDSEIYVEQDNNSTRCATYNGDRELLKVKYN